MENKSELEISHILLFVLKGIKHADITLCGISPCINQVARSIKSLQPVALAIKIIKTCRHAFRGFLPRVNEGCVVSIPELNLTTACFHRWFLFQGISFLMDVRTFLRTLSFQSLLIQQLSRSQLSNSLKNR